MELDFFLTMLCKLPRQNNRRIFFLRNEMTELLLLFFVFVGEVGVASIIYLTSSFTSHPEIIFISVYLLQFVFSIVQGGISDHSCRKKSLIFAFCAILFGQLFFLLAFKYFWMISITVLLYGLLGNVTPISRAALVDTHLKNDFRLSVGLSTVAIALGWVLMMYAAYFFAPFTVCLIVTSLCLLSIGLTFFLIDKADLDEYSGPKKLVKAIKKDLLVLASLLRHSWVSWAMLGYLIAETAFYQVFARGKAQIDNPDVRFVITTWVIGYCAGVFLEKIILRNGSEKTGMVLGALISIASMVALIFITVGKCKAPVFLISTNTFFALGFGFFIPCLFSLISKKHGVHVQGKIYGLIDSVDSLALGIAILIIYLSKTFPVSYLKISSLFFMVFAFFCFVMTIKNISRKSM